MAGLTRPELMRIVNRYIGGTGGYLGDFSYRTHAEFYPEYCDLDVDPYLYEGTTRDRFITILGNAAPNDQARIIRGVVERFPLEADGAPATRTPELREELLTTAQRLQSQGGFTAPELRITSDIVERAISDAEILIRENGPTSGVDRIHTVLHGYLLAACADGGIQHAHDASTTALLKALREQHPALRKLGPRSEDITRILHCSLR